MRADRSPLALAHFLPRTVREQIGPPETLGAELGLLLAFAWRHMLTASTRGLGSPRRRLRLDARPPPSLLPTPGQRLPSHPRGRRDRRQDRSARARGSRRRSATREHPDPDDRPGPLLRWVHREAQPRCAAGEPWRARSDRHRRPGGGAALVLGSRRLESYSGLAGLFDRVEVVFGRESPGVEVEPLGPLRRDDLVDRAHRGSRASGQLGGDRFLYLIQEYEPFTFPMGTYAALADESYRFPHRALFSTELLRDYFRRREIGVYAEGVAPGDRASAVFENAITAVDPPTADELCRRKSRKLLFYARPEPHGSRNMFELGVLALDRAVQEGAFAHGWELRGIGTVDAGRRLDAWRRCRPASSFRDRSRAHYAERAARARRRPGADVHPPSEPGADRDGVGGDAHGHKQLREQDGRGDGGDLLQPDHRRADASRASPPGCGGGRPRRGLRGRARGSAGPLEPRLGPVVRRRPDGAASSPCSRPNYGDAQSCSAIRGASRLKTQTASTQIAT